MKDNINFPEHYLLWWIEPIEFIDSNNLNHYQATIIDYVFRYPHKNWIEDLKKAEWYLKRLIKNEENKLK